MQLRHKLLTFDKPLLMGILNVTPDSFFEKSRVQLMEDVIQKAEQMVQNGADILDLGGHSTRPNAASVSSEEEIERVVPMIEALRKAFPNVVLSVDTYRLSVAQVAIDAGADIFNDIGFGNMDEGVLDWVAKENIPYVLSHSVGKFHEVHQLPNYLNVLEDVWTAMAKKIQWLKERGYNKLIVDPGLGFSKSLDDNYRLLANLEQFSLLGAPILVGVSRKSMICKHLGINANEALNASTALHMAALMKGAAILRVHDVKEAKEVIDLFEKLKANGVSNLS